MKVTAVASTAATKTASGLQANGACSIRTWYTGAKSGNWLVRGVLMNPSLKPKIAHIFKEFLQRRAHTVAKLRLTDLDINPFLLRVLAKELKLHSAKAIVRWLVYQRLERGTVTSFGTCLQEIARLFSEGSAVEGADVLKRHKGRPHHIQVKSGPNTIPKEMAVRITQLLQSAQRRNRGSVALLGMCYGSQERVSSIVKKYVGVDWLVGKEFWEFVSGQPDCVLEIYKIAARVGATFRDQKGKRLSDIVNQKIKELTLQFENEYGKSGERMWRAILDKNT